MQLGTLALLWRADKAGTQIGAPCRGMRGEHGETWWRRAELARYRLLITDKLLILGTAVNAKNAVFASPIHVEFTLRCKVGLRQRSFLPIRTGESGQNQ